jgi:branched-subunit amino acid transport protein
MNNFWLILGIALLVFVLRAVGFFQKSVELSPFWQNFFRYLSLGALTALVVPNLKLQPDSWFPQVGAATLAIIAVRFTRQTWLGILIGLGSFVALRFFFG